ncbi:MAG: hypothetical protein DI551_01880 [Micavibrio aeruginosavorus]|uniref:Uncharacterized protein n=1 Tax=Micavibrio aeruginosavorus TaxID=349221 RepID=A0A2W5N415_9BACT|nr:MAG: hypothetical protein DI551_01880 [Micavibrio aeruginosavorus]
MIRFAVFLFFFFHLAILLKAERFAWLGRITGWGTCALFIFFYVTGVEENSDIVFVILAILTGLSMTAAEFLAKHLKRHD